MTTKQQTAAGRKKLWTSMMPHRDGISTVFSHLLHVWFYAHFSRLPPAFSARHAVATVLSVYTMYRGASEIPPHSKKRLSFSRQTRSLNFESEAPHPLAAPNICGMGG
jgi:hypothetical protein